MHEHKFKVGQSVSFTNGIYKVTQHELVVKESQLDRIGWPRNRRAWHVPLSESAIPQQAFGKSYEILPLILHDIQNPERKLGWFNF